MLCLVFKLEPQRNGGGFIQQDGKKASINKVIDIDNADDYQETQFQFSFFFIYITCEYARLRILSSFEVVACTGPFRLRYFLLRHGS